MGVKWLKAVFFIAGLVLEGYETAGARLEHVESFLLQADTRAQSPCPPRTAQLAAFMNGVKNNTRREAAAPEQCTAMKTRKWAEKAKHRFPICSLPAFS